LDAPPKLDMRFKITGKTANVINDDNGVFMFVFFEEFEHSLHARAINKAS
jgi:hypothetical protein